MRAAIALWLNCETLTLQGLANAALDSFTVCSFFAFVSSLGNALKKVARGSTNPQPELSQVSNNEVRDGVELQRAHQSDFTPEAWEKIQNLPKKADGSTI